MSVGFFFGRPEVNTVYGNVLLLFSFVFPVESVLCVCQSLFCGRPLGHFPLYSLGFVRWEFSFM